MKPILCGKGHPKLWFGNPCRTCIKLEKQAPPAPPASSSHAPDPEALKARIRAWSGR